MPSNTFASSFVPARRALAALLVAGLALVHGSAAFAQNAVNTATVTPPATVTDPNNANNSATDSDPITRTTNLSLTKTASPSPVVVGQTLTYTLTVSNGGPSAILASDTLSLQESLPAGLSSCVYTPSDGTFSVGTIAPGSTGTGTWTGVAIASGGSATLTIACSVTSSAAASITNTATILPPTGVSDPDCSGAPLTCAGNNTSSVGTTVNRPQLAMTKTASVGFGAFTVGVPASYTLNLSNTGTAATTAVATITDTIPTGLTIGTLPAGCSAAGQTVTCTVAAGLAAGGNVSFVIPVTPTLAAGASVTNSATVSGGGDATCPATARCTSQITNAVNAPQLTLAKTASASPWTVGVPASYTLQLSNTGTAATTAVSTITDTIPAGLTIGTLPAGCSAAGQTVTCTVAAGLAAGGSTSFVIPVTPTFAATPSVTNTAGVSGGGDPTCPGDARCTATVGPTPVNAPQLSLAKSASAATWVVGVQSTYTLQLSNTGTAATTAVSTITDTIPAGLTIGTLPAGCSAAGQTVTCTVAAGLLAGGSTSFVIPVMPTAAALPSVTNTASVSGGGDPTCPAAARCTATVGPTPVTTVELTLTKIASASPWTVGLPASYTLVLSNTGAVTTTATATITDTIPASLTIGTLPAGCSAAGQTVTCTVAAGLAAGGSTSFVIPVTPTIAATPSVTNTASVTGGGDPTCPGDARCSSTAGPTPVNAPQLAMTKTSSVGFGAFTVGVPASYTLNLSNTGTAATTAVATITDTIPTGLTIGTLPAGCSAAGQTVTCTVAAGLAAGGSTSFVIPVTPTASAGASVTNTATVSGGGDPTCPATARCSSQITNAVNAPQLTMTKTASAASFTVGVPASYTLQLSNTGTAATTAVSTITDTIPTGLTIGTLPAGCSAAGQTVTCTVAAGLAAGGSTSFVIPVTPTLAATPSVTNTASVSGGGDPTCPGDARCSSTAGPTPVNAPQLTLVKTASASPWTVGVPASYTLQLSNTGTAATTAVSTITDTIPAGLTIGTLPAGCSAAGQTVTCTVAAGLAAGGSTSFVIPVTPTLAATPSVTNTATVSGGGDPTCPGDARCSSSVTTPVNAPELTLAKTASSGSFTVGVAASYTLTVANTGTAATTAVSTITDTIPAGLTIGTLPAGCSAAGQTVTCTVAAGLAAGGSTSFVIPVTPTAAALPSVTNTAFVSGGGDPGCPAAARCTATVGPTPVVGTPALSLEKDAVTLTYSTIGQVIAYTYVVTNSGDVTINAITVVDDRIPTVSCPATTLAAGASMTCTGNYTIVAADLLGTPGTVTNIATANGTPVAGVLTPATDTVTITEAANAIDAVDDDYTPTPIVGASGGTTPSVLVNDTLNGGPATVGVGGNVTLTPGALTSAPAAGSITMNPDGTITVAAGTTAGVYTYTYTICEILNPTNCDTATATVFVDAAPIDAVDDTGTVANGASGGVAVPNVLVNDTLNGAPATLANVTLSQVSTSNQNVTLNPATGAVNVAPGTPAGTYTLVYEICEQLNPTNCDPATVTVTVGAAPIVATPDSGTVANGANGGTAVPNVLVNDTLNGAPATLATVVLTQTATTNPNVTLNPATGAVNVAPGTPAGTYTVTYQICEQLNPTNCATTTVTVTVGAAPIDAVNDSYGPIVGATGGTTASVLVNDTLGGGAVTVGVGGNVTLTPGAAPAPAAGSITMNADGTITVAAGTTAGTYAYPYTICEVLNPTNCDTATATIVVSAAVIDAVNDTGTVANGAAGGTAVANVLVNDTLNGAPATLATVTLSQISTSNPNVTLNPATGAVNVAPGTPAGTYTVTYQICEILNPTNCDTATVTVTVGAAVIDAVDDSYGPIVGATGGTTASVLVNDTLGGGAVTVGVGGNVTLTPGAAPAPAAGSITMNADGTITVAAGTTAGTYAYPYTICEVLNPTNCDTATATIVVSAAVIDAVNDTGTVANGSIGGVAVPNVLVNDTLNGAPATLATVVLTQTATTNPNVTLNPATGAVNVAPGTPAGTYTVTYQICETINPTNCDTATVTVTVGAAPIDAVDDDYTPTPVNGASGGSLPTVLTNDTLGGNPATVGVGGNVTLTPGAAPTPAAGSITMNADGTITVAAGTTAGIYTYPYTICEILNPTNCDTATATVFVDAALIDAVDDTGTVANGASGGTAVPNVLVNDTLNGAPATLANVTLTQLSTSNPNVTLNPATGAVNVAPGTPAGTYTLQYEICEILNPTNCDVATVTVTVGAAVIDAVNDSGTVANGSIGGTAVPNVLVNDTLNGAPATLATVVLTQTATTNPNVTLNPATGAVNVAPGTPAGTYTVTYQICEQLNPTNCDTATVTVTVGAAVIDAVDDDYSPTPVNGASGGSLPTVLTNDTLGGNPVTVGVGGNVTLTPGAAPTPAAGSITMNADGTITVAAGTTAGIYTYPYTICEILNPTNCDTATATVFVDAALIDAVDDSGTVANGASGGVAVPNVLVNDTLNGAPATLANVTLTQLSTSNPNVTLNPATGAVNVAPGTPAGTYTLVYRICEILNPTNCDTATVTVTVGAAPIDAVDDDYTPTPVNGASGGSLPTVLTNDTLGGNPVTVGVGGNVTLTPGAAPTPAAGSITMNPDGTITIAPGTTAGVYTYTYTICEVLNPTNCDTATATVFVDAAPIDAVDDTGAVANGASGGVAVPNVLVNDTLNGAPATLANVTLTQLSTSNPNVTLNPATGAVNVAPGTPAGTYTLQYEICEVLNPANCDPATVTVTVGAAPIDAVNDSGTVANGAVGGVAVPNVLVNDTLNGAPATLATVVLTQTATTNPNVTLNPATGAVSVAPGTPAGTYTVTYQICEQLNPTNCDTATVTVTVGAAVIDAVDDSYGPIVGATGGTTASVLVNDTLGGNPVTVGVGGNVTLTPGAAPTPAAGSITMNPDGTITIAPGTSAGTYAYPYTICEVLNPTNCDTATATIVVAAAVIDAVDDTGTVANGSIGGTAVPNVLVNDTLNGAPATLATVTLSQISTTNPNVTLNPATGAVNVAPGTPAGTYTLVYQICEILNPTNCDTATVTVTVGAAVIDAVDDNYGGVNGVTGTTTASVLVNDTLGGGPVTVGVGGNVTLTPGAAPTPTSGSIAMNPDGTITVGAGTEAGTYLYPYTICEVLNPTNCDTATATVVVQASPALTVDKTASAPTGNTAGSTIAYAFLVTNTGNVTVTGLVINDPMLDAPATCAATTLAPGASTTCSGVHTITQAEVDAGVVNNTATTTGSLPGGGTVTSPPDSTSTPIVQTNALGLVKSSPTGSLTVGSTITYTVTATNTGNTTQTNVLVSDPMLTPNSQTCASVAPGGTCVLTGTYVVQQSDIDAGQIVNTAQVTSTSITTPVTATVVTPIARNPAIRATKTATLTTDNGVPGAADFGDVITYAVSVTNTGNVTMSGLTVTDSFEGGAPVTLACTPTTLAPGATTTCPSYTHTITLAEAAAGGTLDNVVVATATSTGSSQTVSSTSTAVVALNDEPVSIRVVKTASPRDVKVGDLVRYTVTFTNTTSRPMVDGMVVDTPPAGFTYVDGSLTVIDGDNAGRLVGTYPIRVDQIDLAPGERGSITYLLRVGSGVRPGIHTNSAVVMDDGDTVSNVATADVRMAADPVLDESLIIGTVWDDQNGNGVQDAGERGIPGVRIASVEGLLVETDQYGRYHLVGVEVGLDRGRNFILKVDPSTLPPGSTFTTDNPLVRRVTPGLPVRFDFGVKLAKQEIEGGTEAVELELGSVLFAPESSEVRAEYAPVLDKMATTVREHGGGELVIAAAGENDLLAFERAVAVREALASRLPAEVQARLQVTLRANPHDPASTVVGILDWPLIGNVLFETDRAEIRQEYRPLMARIARYIAETGTTRVAVIGHADRRGDADYNNALGMRRAKAVQEAIAAELPAELRGQLRVDVNDDPAAPAGTDK